MKKVALLFVATALVATTFSSCKKEECPVDEPTKMELLTAGEWIGVDVVYYENGVEVDRDFITHFSMLFMNNMDIVAYDNGQPAEVEKWRFLNNQTQIEFLGGYSRSTDNIWDIDTLTTSDLKISETHDNSSGDTEKTVLSLTH